MWQEIDASRLFSVGAGTPSITGPTATANSDSLAEDGSVSIAVLD